MTIEVGDRVYCSSFGEGVVVDDVSAADYPRVAADYPRVAVDYLRFGTRHCNSEHLELREKKEKEMAYSVGDTVKVVATTERLMEQSIPHEDATKLIEAEYVYVTRAGRSWVAVRIPQSSAKWYLNSDDVQPYIVSYTDDKEDTVEDIEAWKKKVAKDALVLAEDHELCETVENFLRKHGFPTPEITTTLSVEIQIKGTTRDDVKGAVDTAIYELRQMEKNSYFVKHVIIDGGDDVEVNF